MKTVWMIKGLFFGLFSFLLFTIFYYGYWTRPLIANKAVSLNLVTGLTLHRPLYWVASILIVLVACVIAKLFHTVR
jgi:hypothetical protein